MCLSRVPERRVLARNLTAHSKMTKIGVTGGDVRGVRCGGALLLLPLPTRTSRCKMAAHWGTFHPRMSSNVGLSTGNNVLTEQGYSLIEPLKNGAHMIVGQRGDLIVAIHSMPEGDGTWMSVFAYSGDSAEAELARNTVRTEIMKRVEF